MCFFVCPSSTCLTLFANFKDDTDSSKKSKAGLNCKIITVLASPERESCKKYVKTEFLNGICESLFALAAITSPRANNDFIIIL